MWTGSVGIETELVERSSVYEAFAGGATNRGTTGVRDKPGPLPSPGSLRKGSFIGSGTTNGIDVVGFADNDKDEG